MLDPEAIVESLSDDVLINVAVHDQPMQSKEVARFLFGVLAETLEELRLSDEIVEGPTAVVLFEARIRDQAAQGLNVIRHDDSGLVRELTVFFRPIEALELLRDVIGSRMAERFSALEGRARRAGELGATAGAEDISPAAGTTSPA